MAWEIVKGQPVIFDCQTGRKYETTEKFAEYASIISGAGTTRLDNLELNHDFLMRWLKNV